MEQGCAVNISCLACVMVTLALSMLFPRESFALWLYPLKAWNSLKARWIVLTQKNTEEGRRGYLEMDMRDFR